MRHGLKRLGGDARDAFLLSLKVHAAGGEAGRMLDGGIGIPEVLFLIPPQYLPFIVNEVCHVMQLFLPRPFILMCFHYCPRHNAYFERFCQLLISVQIIIPLLTQRKEFRVFRHPVGEVVFGEHGEAGIVCSRDSYEVGGSGEVVGGIEGLGGKYQSAGAKRRVM